MIIQSIRDVPAALAAVAYTAEDSVAADVPILCGLAASALAVDYSPGLELPVVADDRTEIREVLTRSRGLVAAVPELLVTDAVLDAMQHIGDALGILDAES